MFIGNLEIEKIEDNKVLFTDGTTKEYTKKELEIYVTEEAKDLTQTRDILIDNIVPAIMATIEEYNVKKGDIQAVLNELVGSYNNTFNNAVGKAFGTYEEGVHNAYYTENIRVTDIKKFI